MRVVARYLLPTLFLAHLIWRALSPENFLGRDLILYNSIWVVALFLVSVSPLYNDRIAISSLAIAIALWGLGSLAVSVDQLISESSRFTAISQLLYATFYPLLLIAIPRLSSKSTNLDPVEILDSLIFGLGFTSILSSLLVTLLFPGGELFNSDNFFMIFYPVGDLALLLALATTFIRSGASRQLLTFSTGILLFTVTDIYFLWSAINGKYRFGSAPDQGWLAALILITASLYIPVAQSSVRKVIHPALVALSIFVSPMLLAISAIRPDLLPIYILIPLIAILLLAFIRMNTALRSGRILQDERHLARTDELTGLANRRHLLSQLDAFSQLEGALMLLDLNEFKPVNDQYGHGVGDAILVEVSKRFHRILPEGALLARLGGDEFGVLFHGSIEDAQELAFALRACLTYPFTVAGREIRVGVSIGLVRNDGAGDLLKRADDAMYRAKRSDMGVVRS
jgi:diguanylate cyclase (GGDEF)-like protein